MKRYKLTTYNLVTEESKDFQYLGELSREEADSLYNTHELDVCYPLVMVLEEVE